MAYRLSPRPLCGKRADEHTPRLYINEIYKRMAKTKAVDGKTREFIVNNIRNTPPPRDRTYDGSQGFAPPYYNIFAYNGYGRSYWLEYKIDFGSNK